MKSIVVWKEKGNAYADYRNNTTRYHLELYRLIQGGEWFEGEYTFLGNLPDRIKDASTELMTQVFTQVEDYAETFQASETRPNEAYEILKSMGVDTNRIGLRYLIEILQKNYIPHDVYETNKE